MSSNPPVSNQNDGNETEPYGGGSSAPSLGAPEPVPDSPGVRDEPHVPDEAQTPDSDVNGDPEQVS
jgi:hypothetical protein